MYLPFFTPEQEAERSAIKTAILDAEEEFYASLPHGKGLPKEWFEWFSPVAFGNKDDKDEKTEKEEAAALAITTSWGFPVSDGRNSTKFPKGQVPLIYKALASDIMIDMYFKRERLAATGLYPTSYFMNEAGGMRLYRPCWWDIVGHTEEEALEVFGGHLGEKAIPQTKEAYCELQKALLDIGKLIVSVEVKKDYLERKSGYKRYCRLVSLGGYIAHEVPTCTPPYCVFCFEVFSPDAAIDYRGWLLEPEEDRRARLTKYQKLANKTSEMVVPLFKQFDKEHKNNKGE